MRSLSRWRCFFSDSDSDLCVCRSKLNKYLCSTLIERQKITLIHRFFHLQKLNLSTDSKLGVERLRKKSVYPWQSKISELNKLTSCSSQMHKRTRRLSNPLVSIRRSCMYGGRDETISYLMSLSINRRFFSLDFFIGHKQDMKSILT